jgi:hypothetical protein
VLPLKEKEAFVIEPAPTPQAAALLGASGAPKLGVPELAPPMTQTQSAETASATRRRLARRRRASSWCAETAR